MFVGFLSFVSYMSMFSCMVGLSLIIVYLSIAMAYWSN